MTSFRACGAILVSLVFFSPTAYASEPVRLTTDGLFKRDLVFWPGGTELVYAVLTLPGKGDDGSVRMMKMKLADGSVSEPDFSKNARTRELAVSADGNVYAFVRHTVLGGGGNTEIEVRNLKLDKKHVINAAPNKKFIFVNQPTLSPDGSRIVYMGNSHTLQSLELWKEKAVEVTIGQNGDMWPNFSPDGRLIVFTSRRDKDYEIYVMNADGTQPKRLTNSPGLDMNAVFSPDSKQIAFTSNRDGNYEIYVMNADGTNVRRVTNHPERDDFPCWSPDGRLLYFVGERNGKFDIYKTEVPK